MELWLWIVTAIIINSAVADIQEDIENIVNKKPLQPTDGQESVVPESEVKFLLSTKQKKNVTISQNNVDPVETSKPIKVIIHGWSEKGTGHGNEYYKPMTDAFLEKGDFNVITVDWDKPAQKEYAISSFNTRAVGARVGDVLVKIIKEKKIGHEKIHIIGHSLGAHVAGFAAQRIIQETGSKVKHVTGLDAAGPLFEVPPQPKDGRLSDNDASIVEAIHTDGGVFGFLEPLGTIDFYPNGGVREQPGCTAEDLFCSHHKSYKYYIKAINQGGIEATKCGLYTSYKSGSCKDNKKVKMGGELTENDKGKYYLKIDS